MKVKFYIEDGSEVLAVFPDQIENNRTGALLCYAHIGQHSSCTKEYLAKCRPAKAREYKDLLAELKSVGYEDLEILNKKEPA